MADVDALQARVVRTERGEPPNAHGKPPVRSESFPQATGETEVTGRFAAAVESGTAGPPPNPILPPAEQEDHFPIPDDARAAAARVVAGRTQTTRTRDLFVPATIIQYISFSQGY